MSDKKVAQKMVSIRIHDESIVDVYEYADTTTRFERGKSYEVTEAEAKQLLGVVYDHRLVFCKA
jgi:hypothetical protein